MQSRPAASPPRGMVTLPDMTDGGIVGIAGSKVPAAEAKPVYTPKWEAAGTAFDEELRASSCAIRTLACTDDSLVAGSARPIVTVWKVAEAKLVPDQQRLSQGAVGTTSLDVAEDRRTIAVCSDDGGIRIWDLRDKRKICELEANLTIACKVKFVDGNRRLVSGGPSGALGIWDLGTRTLEREVVPEEAIGRSAKRSRGSHSHHGASAETVHPVYSLAVSDDGGLVGCGRSSGGVGLFRLDTCAWAGSEARAHRGVTTLSPVRALTFASNSRLLISGGDDHHVCLFDAGAWARQTRSERGAACPPPRIERFSAHSGWVTSVSSCPDPSRHVLLTTSWDTTTKLWDIRTHALLHTFKDHKDSALASAFAPSGRFFATAGSDAQLVLYTAKDDLALVGENAPPPAS